MVDLPLSLRGKISYLSSAYPTDEQLNTCSHTILTSSEIWDPYSKEFEQNEDIYASAVTSKSSYYGGGGVVRHTAPIYSLTLKGVTMKTLGKHYASTQ